MLNMMTKLIALVLCKRKKSKDVKKYTVTVPLPEKVKDVKIEQVE